MMRPGIKAGYLFILLVFLSIPTVALAFHPAWMKIIVEEPSADLVYLDIMVPKTLAEVHMEYVNSAVGTQYPIMKEALEALECEGFVSYSLYYKDSSADPLLRENENARYFAEGQYQRLDQLKIVTVDQQGKLLQISNTVSVKADFLHMNGVPIISYNDPGNKASVSFEPYALPFFPLATFFLISRGLPSVIAATLFKSLTSALLKIKPVRTIILLSLATQGLVAVATPLLTALIPFWIAFIAMELLAIFAEYLGLAKKATYPAGPNLLIYVLTANTATAMLNALIFCWSYGFFRL